MWRESRKVTPPAPITPYPLFLPSLNDQSRLNAVSFSSEYCVVCTGGARGRHVLMLLSWKERISWNKVCVGFRLVNSEYYDYDYLNPCIAFTASFINRTSISLPDKTITKRQYTLYGRHMHRNHHRRWCEHAKLSGRWRSDIFPGHTSCFTFRIKVVKPGLIYSYKSWNKVVRIFVEQSEKTCGCFSAIGFLNVG